MTGFALHLLLILAAFQPLPLQAEDPMADDVALISERLRARLLAGAARGDLAHSAARLVERQAADGSWADVDYDDESRTHWNPDRHLWHLLVAARAYRGQSSLQGDPRLAECLRAGLQYWVDRHPVSDNWWYNVIAAPRGLSDILLLTADELEPELIEATAALVRESGFARTGANLVDEASNLLTLACATGDADLLRQAARHIAGEVRVTADEGIQADDSFYQHGPQNMVISYGQGFASDQAGFAELFAGTAFAYTDEQIRILSRFVLDGQQWFVRGRQIDYHAMGRGAFRGGPGNHSWNAGGFARLCGRMATADPARAAEYVAFAARATGEAAPGSSGPLGNKHYWRSDAMVHREAGWYASVRFHSTRVYATETRTNRENLKGYHLADGTYFLLRRGDEYHEIQPVWNYRRLPGLTCRDTRAPLPYGDRAPRAGNTEFVGGASDGLYGVAVMDYDKEGVKAKKAYFFGRDGFACLGAGIEAARPSGVVERLERVLTTLNQCRLRGDVTALGRDGDLREVPAGGAETSAEVVAIHHDDVAYVLWGTPSVGIQARQQSGSWREVEAAASDEPVPQEVFTCWVDHGVAPSGASYAYRVVPSVRRRELRAVAGDESVQILANTPGLQSVHDRDAALVQAVFHAPGELAVPEGVTLHVDRPCVLMWRQVGAASLLTVADPTQAQPQVIARLSRPYAGRGAAITAAGTQVVVDLPRGDYAGQSVAVLLEPVE